MRLSLTYSVLRSAAIIWNLCTIHLCAGQPSIAASDDASLHRTATTQTSAAKAAAAQLPPSVNATAVGDREYAVTFTYVDPNAKKVYLAGPFNHWNSSKDLMVETANGKWSLTITLDEGEVPYKFVVDGTWTKDPQNPEGADDNNGGLNSILRLGRSAQVQVSTQTIGDHKVFSDSLIHKPEEIFYFNPLSNGKAVVKLQAAAHDLDAANLVIASNSGQSKIPMAEEYSDNRTAVFRANMEHDNSKDSAGTLTFQYCFLASDGQTSVAINNSGTHPFADAGDFSQNAFSRTIIADDIFVTPRWASSVVWYQIFPERFRSGSKDNDPVSTQTTLRKWTSDWWERSENETGRAMEPGVFGRRYGGDLQGIIEKLPYLKSLGISAIYLNPVFEAESLHKYEATDYRHIDDNFGYAGDYAEAAAQEDLLTSASWKFTPTDKLFLEMISRAHGAGMKVVIDGVFNHTGTDHPAFQDILKNGKRSPYAEWYNVTNWEPFEYEGWAGGAGLPVLKEDEDGFASKELEQHFFDITSRWMDPNSDGDPSDGIDGWRLDVPNEVSSEWWRRWRDHVKAINPDAIIIGEIWDPPSKWLQGDQFDSVMNYQLAQALTRFFTNGGNATDLRQDIAKLLASVPDQANYAMMNLMNSHDTDRLVSQLNNPGRGYDARNRQQDIEPGTYSSDKPSPEVYARLKQLTAVQFTLVGSPMIYYGDEAGMWGADDPEDRKPMIWQDLEPYQKPEENYFMKDVHAHYQRLAALRNTYPALQHGSYRNLLSGDADRVFAFVRTLDDDRVVVVTNDSDTTRAVGLTLGVKAEDLSRYVEVLRDPAVKTVPAGNNSSGQTALEIGPAADKLKAEAGQLKVQVPPRSTSVYVSVR